MSRRLPRYVCSSRSGSSVALELAHIAARIVARTKKGRVERGLFASGGTIRRDDQYDCRSRRISCRIVVAISSIDLCVDDSHLMPSRRIIASASLIS